MHGDACARRGTRAALFLGALLLVVAGRGPRASAQDAPGAAEPDADTAETGEDAVDASEEADDDAIDPNLEPIETIDLEALLSTPIVESASRREQSLHDAPAAVGIVSADQIAAMGAVSVPDALRRLAGVHVMQTNANTYYIGLRGFNSVTNNRVLVLLDGRQVDEPAVGYAPWAWLPVHPGEVETIEVIRGPFTTLYGSNALSGVISVTTRSPIDHPGPEAEVANGLSFAARGLDVSARESSLSSVAVGYGSYAVVNEDQTLGARLRLGFHHHPEFVDTGEAGFFRNGEFGYSTGLALEGRPRDDLDLLLTLTHTLVEPRSTNATLNDPLALAVSDQAFNLGVTWTGLLDEALDFRGRVDGERLQFESGGEETLSYQVHGLLQGDLHLFEDRSVFTLGGEISHTTVDDLFGISPNATTLSLMAQEELHLLTDRALVLSAGVRLEQVAYQDDQGIDITYRNLNPRAAVIYKVGDEHDIRLSAATAYRTPTPFEASVGVSVGIYQEPTPPNRFVLANPGLEPEQARSLELGYRGELFDIVRLETVVFVGELLDRIDLRRSLSVPVVFENVQSVTQYGTEIGLELVPSQRFNAYVHYTFTRSVDQETDEAVHDFPEHLFGLGFDYAIPSAARLHADLIFREGLQPRIPLGSASGGFEIQEPEQPAEFLVNVRVATPVLGGAGELFVWGRNLLGFTDDFDRLRQYPTTTADPIGATVLVGLRLRED